MEQPSFLRNNLVKVFSVIVLCIFFSEFIIMSFLEEVLDNKSHFIESSFDAILLALIVSPILYFFAFKHFDKEIKKDKETEKKYKFFFEHSNEAIMTLYPPDWKFSEGNTASFKMFGLKDVDELKIVTPGDVSPEFQSDGKPSFEKAKEMIDIALEKGSNSFEWTHKKLNGPDFFANVSLTKFEIDDDIYLWAVVRDNTEEKKSIEKAKKLAEEVSKSLAEAERSNKLMVGRELEMIKLKKEIMELKDKENNN